MAGDSSHPFVLDREAFDALGTETVKILGAYLRALPNEPVDRVVPQDVRQRLPSLGNPTRSMIQRPRLFMRKMAEWSKPSNPQSMVLATASASSAIGAGGELTQP